MTNYIDVFGIIGSVLLPIIPIPQIYEIYVNKSGHNISLLYILLQIIANSLFFVYGLGHEDLIIFFPNLILVFQNLIIIILVIYYNQKKIYNNMDFQTSLQY